MGSRQTFHTIAPYTIEEAYEVADVIVREQWDELPDELGDLLFQVVFHAQLASEQNLFDFEDVVQAIVDKMIRRHPHVFGDVSMTDETAQNIAWEAHKTEERARRGKDESLLDPVANSLPSLKRAAKMQKRAATVGFDWSSVQQVLPKLREELRELEEVINADEGESRISAELGDLLFTCVNVARHLGVDPDAALRGANLKFETRFRRMEHETRTGGRETAPREVMKWRWLLGCQAIAFGLLGSWLYTPTRTWWNHLDNAVFTTLDSTLAEFAPGWQVFWAIGNNRVMVLVMAVVFAGLFLHFVFSGKRNRILPGLAIGCFIALHAFIVLELSREVTFERLSPTLVEASAIRLSETVAWAQPKDASENSFPSDHAIALFIIASMIWFYAGRRYGVLAVACAMPRVFAGAHWATDLLVGSVFVVLLFQSLLLATPLHLLIERVLAISITRVLDLLTRARVAISYYRIQSRQRFLGADQPVGTDPDPL